MNLTPKEEQTLKHLSEGLSAKEIACLEGNLSPWTIRKRINNMLERNGAKNSTHLVSNWLKVTLAPKSCQLNS